MAHILLVGILRNGLTVAREFSRAGHTVHIGVNEPDPYLFASRHVRNAFWHPPLDRQPERALAAIRGYLDAHPEITVLFPVSEVSVRLFSRRRDRFSARVTLVLPSERVVETCIDKVASFRLCDRLGLPIAPRAFATDPEGLRRAVAAIGRPCVIKPVDALEGIFGRKAVVLDAGDALEAAIPGWPDGHRELCVQRRVDGPRHTVNFAAHGRPGDRRGGHGNPTHGPPRRPRLHHQLRLRRAPPRSRAVAGRPRRRPRLHRGRLLPGHGRSRDRAGPASSRSIPAWGAPAGPRRSATCRSP